MKHDLNDLTERLKFNREHNLSFDSSDLIEEVNEDIELYSSNAQAAVWCDPKDNFVKDYFVINTEKVDPEEQAAINADKIEFSKNKNSDDIYIITLLELMDVLEYQSRIVWKCRGYCEIWKIMLQSEY